MAISEYIMDVGIVLNTKNAEAQIKDLDGKITDLGNGKVKVGIEFDKADVKDIYAFVNTIEKISPKIKTQIMYDYEKSELEKLQRDLKELENVENIMGNGSIKSNLRDYVANLILDVNQGLADGLDPSVLEGKMKIIYDIMASYEQKFGTDIFSDLAGDELKKFQQIEAILGNIGDRFENLDAVEADRHFLDNIKNIIKRSKKDITGYQSILDRRLEEGAIPHSGPIDLSGDSETEQFENVKKTLEEYKKLRSLKKQISDIHIDEFKGDKKNRKEAEQYFDGLANGFDEVEKAIQNLEGIDNKSEEIEQQITLLKLLKEAYVDVFSNELDKFRGSVGDSLFERYQSRSILSVENQDYLGITPDSIERQMGELLKSIGVGNGVKLSDIIRSFGKDKSTELFSVLEGWESYATLESAMNGVAAAAQKAAEASKEDAENTKAAAGAAKEEEKAKTGASEETDLDKEIAAIEKRKAEIIQLQEKIDEINVGSGAKGMRSPSKISDAMSGLNTKFISTMEEIKNLEASGDDSNEIKDRIKLLYAYAEAYAKAFKESIPKKYADNLDKRNEWLDKNVNSSAKNWDILKYDDINGAFQGLMNEASSEQIDLNKRLTELERQREESLKSAAHAQQEGADSARQTADEEKRAADEAERRQKAEEKSESKQESDQSDRRQGSDSEKKQEEDLGDKTKGFNKEQFEAVNEILESINQSLKDISTSLGTVDEESGLNNLISSLKTVNDLIKSISQKDFNVIFNEATQGGSLETFLDKEINKVRERYSQAYDSIMEVGQKYGLGQHGVLEMLYGPDEKRTGFQDPSTFFDRFSKDALSQLDPKDYITRVQELIKYVKIARKEMSDLDEVYDPRYNGFFGDLNSLRLPTEDTQEVKRRLDNAVKQQQQQQASDIIKNAAAKSTQGVQQEDAAMRSVAMSAEEAAAAKEAFAKANEKLGASAEESAAKVKAEADAVDQVNNSTNQQAGNTPKSDNEYLKQIDNFKKFLSNGLAEKYMPDTVEELRTMLNSIGDPTNIGSMIDLTKTFPQALDDAKNKLNQILGRDPDKVKTFVDKLKSDIESFAKQPLADSLMNPEIESLRTMADNIADYESAQKLAAALKEAVAQYKEYIQLQQKEDKAKAAINQKADTAKQRYKDIIDEGYVQKYLPDVYNDLQAAHVMLKPDEASIADFNKSLDEAAEKIKRNKQLQQEWADVVNDAFTLNNDLTGENYKMRGSLKVGDSGDTLAKRSHMIEEDIMGSEITPENVQRIRGEVQQLRKDADGALDGMKKDVLDIVSDLNSGRSKYIKNVGIRTKNDENKSLPGGEVVDNLITDYEEKMKRAVSLVEEMKQRWGENTTQVKEASDAVENYNKKLAEDLVSSLHKRATDQKDRVSAALTNIKENKLTEYTPEYKAALENIVAVNNTILSQLDQIDFSKPFDSTALEKVVDVAKKAGPALDNAAKAMKGLASPSNIQELKGNIDHLLQKVNKDLSRGGLRGDLKNQYIDLQHELEKYSNALSDAKTQQEAFSKTDFKALAAQYDNLRATAIKLGQDGEGFLKKFSTAISNQSAQFLATYVSIQDMLRYSKEIAQTVVQTDSALVELRKVSNESNDRIQESFQKSAETAQEMGSTVTDVVNSTADWSRLGYDIGDAEELARVTTLFQKVGDNMTQESASQSLVSMLQGFQMDASQAERIVDSVNAVANNFAIDTAGIGDALQRSAAAFNAAGTDLNKSIALVTTANAVVQDPSSVGKHLPTWQVIVI